MKVKLDENMPASAAELLIARGYDVDTVHDEGLGGQPDDAVWQAAQAEERFLVTQDLDFSDIRKFAPGTHHGVMLVRLPDSEQWRVRDYIVAWLSDPDAHTWARCVVVGDSHESSCRAAPEPRMTRRAKAIAAYASHAPRLRSV